MHSAQVQSMEDIDHGVESGAQARAHQHMQPMRY